MRKIFVSAGHSNKPGRDRGAVGNGFVEGDLTVELRDLIVRELEALGNKPLVDGNNSILSETLNKFKSLTNPDAIVLDIHWNAATPLATGVETLIPSNNSTFERKLAEALSDVVSNTLNITKRGIKGVKTEAESHHGSLGWMKLIGENVLLEVCFVSNKTDMTKYQSLKQNLSRNIAKTLFEFSKENTDYHHVVVKGDTLSSIARIYNTNVAKLVAINNLSSSNSIKVGQIIKTKN